MIKCFSELTFNWWGLILTLAEIDQIEALHQNQFSLEQYPNMFNLDDGAGAREDLSPPI